MSKGLYWTTVVLSGLFLIQYWLKFLFNFELGNVAGYKNYWGADVGIYLMLAVLLVSAPAFLYLAWKHYPQTKKKATRDEL